MVFTVLCMLQILGFKDLAYEIYGEWRGREKTSSLRRRMQEEYEDD